MSAQNKQPGCLALILRLFGGGKPRDGVAGETATQKAIQDGAAGETTTQKTIQDAKVYPYRVRDNFLTPAELSFYQVLKMVVEAQTVIFVKVRLWDIFYVARPDENRKAMYHIDQKHVDFLLCHPDTLQPLMGIELDDASHQREERQQRDELVDSVFQTAELLLVRVPARYNYDVDEIATLLLPDVEAALTRHKDRQANAGEPPLCPDCGISMVIRTATKGAHQGEPFYGCPNYPECQRLIPIKE